MGWGGQFYFAISGERELSLRLSGGLQILIVNKKRQKEAKWDNFIFQSCKLWEYIAKFGLTSWMSHCIHFLLKYLMVGEDKNFYHAL